MRKIVGKNRTVLVAPHLDDIAFSIGALAYQYSSASQGSTVFLLNVFTKSSYCLPDFKSKNINHQRASEDRCASELLGLKKIDLGLPDASLLNHTDRSEMICTPHDFRTPWLKSAFHRVLNQLSPTKILLPLALGGHIDHSMVRDAGISLLSHCDVELNFYEDLPYAYYYELEELPDIIAKRFFVKQVRHGFEARRISQAPKKIFNDAIPLAHGRKLWPKWFDITSIWPIKREAIACYTSQVSDAILDKIHAHALRLGSDNLLFERVWCLK